MAPPVKRLVMRIHSLQHHPRCIRQPKTYVEMIARWVADLDVQLRLRNLEAG